MQQKRRHDPRIYPHSVGIQFATIFGERGSDSQELWEMGVPQERLQGGGGNLRTRAPFKLRIATEVEREHPRIHAYCAEKGFQRAL